MALKIAILVNTLSTNRDFWTDVRTSYSEALCSCAHGRNPLLRPRLRAKVPDPSRYDLIILSGGKADASSSEPWVLGVLDFIRNTVSDTPRTKILGICWGHQAIARAYGGEVRAVPTGPIAAIQDLALTEAGKQFFPFAAETGSYWAPEFHVREVYRPAPGFIPLAEKNEYFVNGANTVLSSQTHPELGSELAKKMLLEEDDCDEKKPACGTCVRLGKPCVSVRPELKFRHVAVPAAVRRDTATTVKESEQGRIRRRPAEDQDKGTGILGCLGSLDLIRSLQHVERDVCYSTYWEDRCLPAMHPIFLSMSIMADRPSQLMLRVSILALSSRQFSRQQVERKTSSASHMGSFSPSLSHQTRSHLYYSAAITRMSRIGQQIVSADTTVVVAVLTLFAYIEASVGNFEGFRCHVNGMSQLLESHLEILNDPANKALILTSLYVHGRLPSVPLPPALEGNYDLLHNRRVLVLSVLCESHRLNSCEVLRWVGIDATVNIADRQPMGLDGNLEACFHALGKQGHRRNDWLAHLSPSDLLIFEGQPSGDTGRLEGPRLPIFFESHDAALNYAYYTLCRVLQCRGLLRSLQCHSARSNAYRFEEEEGWIWLLLRIAKCTCFQTSFARNNYTIGFPGLLLAALLRCQSPVLGE
ncbi:uncharacterized protein BDW70DRAFT_155464 [Aspergillus foveolatus]|uniref:uncharacterized protein n=1 Tax=Aspergillus foveolatus TaxID=210207 RepID=UPI003CCD7542